jgi:hypothetical protein
VWVLCFAGVLAAIATPARADLVISIGSASVTQGGTGTIDVLLMSTASSQAPDLINNFGFQLQITNNGVDNTQLAFSANQNFGYLSDTTLNPQYVFLGDSIGAGPPPSGGIVTTTIFPQDTFVGLDSTASGNPVSLSAGTTYLLASLSISTLTGAPPTANDSFTISLVPPAADGSINTSTKTFFDNFDFTTGAELSATPFTSTSGTVTIVAAAVPEPASIVSGLTAIMVLGTIRVFGWFRRARRRQASPAGDVSVRL